LFILAPQLALKNSQQTPITANKPQITAFLHGDVTAFLQPHNLK